MTDQGPAFVMRVLALSCVAALGGALALNATDTTLSADAQAQQAPDESPANIIAVRRKSRPSKAGSVTVGDPRRRRVLL